MSSCDNANFKLKVFFEVNYRLRMRGPNDLDFDIFILAYNYVFGVF